MGDSNFVESKRGIEREERLFFKSRVDRALDKTGELLVRCSISINVDSVL